MARKRRPGTEWLPERCYQGRSAYEYRAKIDGELKIIRLCSLAARQHVVWARYEEEKRKLEMSAGSVESLFNEFFESPECSKLSLGTIKQYQKNAKQLNKVFGRLQAKAIKPEHVRKYMDIRGQKHEVSANREKAFMSRVYSWAYERGKVPMNPCKGVRKFTEVARSRYITDEEYAAVYNQAPPILQAIMEISYCCAARKNDVLGLTNDKLLKEGILIKQGKTQKEQIKSWSPRLRAAIKLAQTSTPTSNFKYVICNRKGNKITDNVLDKIWDKARTEAGRKNPEMKTDFTFHDIKAKAISDYDGDKKKFSGHKSASMVDTYNRKIEIVDTH